MAYLLASFDDLGVTQEFSKADIINRAVDFALTLCFPEFDENDVLNVAGIVVMEYTAMIPIKIKINLESESF